MWKFNYTDELYHHGVPGMKWGVRRYQNKDGSLTPAGKRRADKLRNQYTELTGKRITRKPAKAKTKKVKQNTKTSIKDLSDDELRKYMNRLQMEKQTIQLEKDLAPKGKKFISKIGNDVIKPSAIEAGKRLLTDSIVKVGKKRLNLEEGADDIYKDLRKEVEGFELEARKIKAKNKIEQDRLEKEKAANKK